MAWEVDFTDQTPETMDAVRPDPGWYNAEVVDTKEDPEKGDMHVVFKILGPRFIGAQHTEYLQNPAYSRTEQATVISARKLGTWALRLGLATKADAGTRKELDWSKAVGVRVVLHLKEDAYTGSDGKTKTPLRCDWAPYDLLHEKIPADVRSALGLPILPGQSCAVSDGAATGTKKPPALRKPKSHGDKTSAPPAKTTDELVAELNI